MNPFYNNKLKKSHASSGNQVKSGTTASFRSSGFNNPMTPCFYGAQYSDMESPIKAQKKVTKKPVWKSEQEPQEEGNTQEFMKNLFEKNQGSKRNWSFSKEYNDKQNQSDSQNDEVDDPRFSEGRDNYQSGAFNKEIKKSDELHQRNLNDQQSNYQVYQSRQKIKSNISWILNDEEDQTEDKSINEEREYQNFNQHSFQPTFQKHHSNKKSTRQHLTNDKGSSFALNQIKNSFTKKPKKLNQVYQNQQLGDKEIKSTIYQVDSKLEYEGVTSSLTATNEGASNRDYLSKMNQSSRKLSKKSTKQGQENEAQRKREYDNLRRSIIEELSLMNDQDWQMNAREKIHQGKNKAQQPVKQEKPVQMQSKLNNSFNKASTNQSYIPQSQNKKKKIANPPKETQPPKSTRTNLNLPRQNKRLQSNNTNRSSQSSQSMGYRDSYELTPQPQRQNKVKDNIKMKGQSYKQYQKKNPIIIQSRVQEITQEKARMTLKDILEDLNQNQDGESNGNYGYSRKHRTNKPNQQNTRVQSVRTNYLLRSKSKNVINGNQNILIRKASETKSQSDQQQYQEMKFQPNRNKIRSKFQFKRNQDKTNTQKFPFRGNIFDNGSSKQNYSDSLDLPETQIHNLNEFMSQQVYNINQVQTQLPQPHHRSAAKQNSYFDSRSKRSVNVQIRQSKLNFQENDKNDKRFQVNNSNNYNEKTSNESNLNSKQNSEINSEKSFTRTSYKAQSNKFTFKPRIKQKQISHQQEVRKQTQEKQNQEEQKKQKVNPLPNEGFRFNQNRKSFNFGGKYQREQSKDQKPNISVIPNKTQQKQQLNNQKINKSTKIYQAPLTIQQKRINFSNKLKEYEKWQKSSSKSSQKSSQQSIKIDTKGLFDKVVNSKPTESSLKDKQKQNTKKPFSFNFRKPNAYRSNSFGEKKEKQSNQKDKQQNNQKQMFTDKRVAKLENQNNEDSMMKYNLKLKVQKRKNQAPFSQLKQRQSQKITNEKDYPDSKQLSNQFQGQSQQKKTTSSSRFNFSKIPFGSKKFKLSSKDKSSESNDLQKSQQKRINNSIQKTQPKKGLQNNKRSENQDIYQAETATKRDNYHMSKRIPNINKDSKHDSIENRSQYSSPIPSIQSSTQSEFLKMLEEMFEATHQLRNRIYRNRNQQIIQTRRWQSLQNRVNQTFSQERMRSLMKWKYL